MNKELEIYLKDLALDQLMKTQLGDKIEYAMKTFSNVQKHLYALSEKEGEEKAVSIKIATIMTFSILKKYQNGKMPAELTKEEWKEIANAVSEYAVLADDQDYVKFVFRMYECYIRDSADRIESRVPEKTVLAIRLLADELHEKGNHFQEGEIDEVKYIEDCLWISLEAMIKLIASMASVVLNEDYAEYVQALAAYAFEYGRFVLYRQEQALINELLETQYELDAQLEEKYALFKEELEDKAQHFYVLIENAFVTDFRETFLHSIALAQAAGVDDGELLTDLDDIDSFFMD